MREREVAYLVRQGWKSEEIARKVGLDDEALQACLQDVYSKLDVGDPLALALYLVYHRLGLRQPQGQEGGAGEAAAAAS